MLDPNKAPFNPRSDLHIFLRHAKFYFASISMEEADGLIEDQNIAYLLQLEAWRKMKAGVRPASDLKTFTGRAHLRGQRTIVSTRS